MIPLSLEIDWDDMETVYLTLEGRLAKNLDFASMREQTERAKQIVEALWDLVSYHDYAIVTGKDIDTNNNEKGASNE